LENFLKKTQNFSWRWIIALIVSFCGLIGFLSGVEVSERDISDAGFITHLYHTLGLFILGGMDLGTPVNGPVWGQVLLWIGYFGAPLLTGSAIIEWLHQLVDQQSMFLRNISDHFVLIGTEEVARSILEKIIFLHPDAKVIVVERAIHPSLTAELSERYDTRTVEGDFTNEFFLRSLRVSRARQIIVASGRDFDNFEAASRLLEIKPELGHRLLVHSNRLRFLRMLNNSTIVDSSLTFNSYHLAAQYLVKQVMLKHFDITIRADIVVIAGFGRFGQTILEELQKLGPEVVAEIAIIDSDALRRVLVAEEQVAMNSQITRHVFQGDISHPEVWANLEAKVNLHNTESLILLATGADDENLRTGLWLKRKHSDAKVMVRTTRPSHFAETVCASADIDTFAQSQLMYNSMPDAWFNQDSI
jgi:Trk K+ transport system NAD-binding subunit